MNSSSFPEHTPLSRKPQFWKIAAAVGWLIVLLVFGIRCGIKHHHTVAFVNFRLAGEHWLHGEYLYSDPRGFVYSPLAAVIFAPFAAISPALGIVFWQALNVVILLAGVATIARGLFPAAVEKWVGICCLLLIPLTLGNLDIGHSNPLLIGLLMLGIAAASQERWNWAAVCIALATHLKIYPLALGLLLCVASPRRFSLRLAIALLGFAAVPFIFQHWSYVADQYHAWAITRIADNRFAYGLEDAPLDLWFVLHWTAHLPISRALYAVLQLGGALLAAMTCAWGRYSRWSRERLLQGVFALGCAWMLLLGPATEAYTYTVLGPGTLLLCFQAYRRHQPNWLKVAWSIALLLQLLAVARRSLLPKFNPQWALSAEPVSALLIFAVFLVWALRDVYWPEHPVKLKESGSTASFPALTPQITPIPN